MMTLKQIKTCQRLGLYCSWILQNYSFFKKQDKLPKDTNELSWKEKKYLMDIIDMEADKKPLFSKIGKLKKFFKQKFDNTDVIKLQEQHKENFKKCYNLYGYAGAGLSWGAYNQSLITMAAFDSELKNVLRPMKQQAQDILRKYGNLK